MYQRKSLKHYVTIILLLFLPLVSCGPQYKAAKEQRQQEKRIEERRIAGERSLNEGKKRHLQTQSRETRKRMKQSRRQSERLNKNKKIPFYKRWFNALRNR
jgi:hypothetical protein